jgi:hypothetical protein
MSFHCDICGKDFEAKRNLQYHTNNKVCVDKAFKCKYCEHSFSSKSSMCRHISTYCKGKRKQDIRNEQIKNEVILNELVMQMQEQIKQLQTTVQEMKNDKNIELNTNTTNNGTVNNNTNNGSVTNNMNNGTVNNIILVGYGNEDLSKLSKSDILKALQTGYNSTVKLTEAVHFNPNFPEYHNVYISNMKDKYAMMHDGEKWTLTTKEDLISKIYDDKKNYIEENLEEFIESLHPARKRALARWLDTDDEDTKVKEIKENIKLLLYNSRDKVIDNKKVKELSKTKTKTKSKSKKVIKDK